MWMEIEDRRNSRTHHRVWEGLSQTYLASSVVREKPQKGAHQGRKVLLCLPGQFIVFLQEPHWVLKPVAIYSTCLIGLSSYLSPLGHYGFMCSGAHFVLYWENDSTSTSLLLNFSATSYQPFYSYTLQWSTVRPNAGLKNKLHLSQMSGYMQYVNNTSIVIIQK